MYICVWGDPRTGKSTFCMDLMYYIYKDWDKVLSANVFNLNQILYQIKKGIPERWPTLNKLHNRIPILNWDDFAAHSGKAKTQHDKAWDVFKGAFDTLGTKLGVLLVNMVSPRSPTQQLQEKYTHEVWIPWKGHYKYDEVHSRQDYRGWKPQISKEWLDEDDFDPMPMEIFKEYDEMRMSLADEVLQSVEDTMVDTHMDTLVKRVQPTDIELLTLIKNKGMVYGQIIDEALGPHSRLTLTRCKSRGLVIPIRIKGQYYKYDITELGLELLDTLAKQKEKQVADKVAPHL